jgi:hypothetical protein
MCGGCHSRQETVEQSERAHPPTVHHRRRGRRHPQCCRVDRPQASASQPNPRSKVAVGRGGGRRQLRRDRANLVLHLRAVAASIPVRLIPFHVAEGERRAASDLGTERLRSALGPCATVGCGRQWSPAVSDGSEEPQVAGPPVHATGIMDMGDSDCGPEGRVGDVGAADGQQPVSVTTGEPAREPWRIMTADPAIDGH